eukprot:11063945-Heterocapsa_arctica.AAC.1
MEKKPGSRFAMPCFIRIHRASWSQPLTERPGTLRIRSILWVTQLLSVMMAVGVQLHQMAITTAR